MGADLYIRNISGNNYADQSKPKAWESEQGYFRDSYNHTSVMWTLGLSWWKDITPLCNKNGELKGKKLIKARDLIANAMQTLPKNESELKTMNLVFDKDNTVEIWQEYFKNKRQKLLDFFNRAIELNTSIDCSL